MSEPAPTQGAHESPTPEGSIDTLLAQLVDSQSDANVRASAIAALLLSSDPRARSTLESAIRDDIPNGTRRSVATRIAQGPSFPPPNLIRPLSEALADRLSPDRGAVLGALGRYETKSAVGAVIGVLTENPAPDPALLTIAMDTLRRQTGVSMPDESAWQAWWQEHAPLDAREWNEMVAQQQARRADDAESRADILGKRLVDTYRRLHALLPEAERSSLIAQLINGDTSELVFLGFDLAKRALLNARNLDDRVGEAAIARLQDHDPQIRSESASLLSRLDTQGAAVAVADALTREQNDAAAAAMLRCMARVPITGAAGDVVRWLENGNGASAAAADAALAMRKAGAFTDPSLVDRTRAALRARPADSLTPSAAALLALLGETQAAVELLKSASPDVAEAVAGALAQSPDGVDPLVHAALERPSLSPTAIAALATHRPTADAFMTAASLSCESPEARRAALAQFAKSLPPADLLRVATAESDAATRLAYLADVRSLPIGQTPQEQQTRADLAELLARTQLALRDPAGALEAIAPFSPEDERWARMFDPLRVTALLWLFQLPWAEEAGLRSQVPASCWLDGLEAAIDLPYAIDIADQIRRVFGDALSPGDLARLETAERYINANVEGPPAMIDER